MAARETSRGSVSWDECMCCGDHFLEEQIDDSGYCTMCANARATYNRDGIPAGRPCCRRYLSELKKQNPRARA